MRVSEAEGGERNVFVLSGGGSLGAAQVGMLHALFAEGILPHAFVGCSVGALNATFLASGPVEAGIETLIDTWLSLRRPDFFPPTPVMPLLNLLRRKEYLFTSTRLRKRLDAWFADERIEDLERPLRIVTTDLVTGSAAYHDAGSLQSALLASTALPGVFPPVRLSLFDGDPGTLHVDGGVSDLVPLSGALALPATHVYVLDVTAHPALEPMRSPLHILIRSLSIATRLSRDVRMRPGIDMTHIRCDWHRTVAVGDFSHTRGLIAAGERAAHAALGTPGRHGIADQDDEITPQHNAKARRFSVTPCAANS